MTAEDAKEKAMINFIAKNRDIMDAIHKAVRAGTLMCEIEMEDDKYRAVADPLRVLGYDVEHKAIDKILTIKFT